VFILNSAHLSCFQLAIKALYANAADVRSKALYCRMLADLQRYRIDCAANQEDANTAKLNANNRYMEAKKISRNFDSSDLVCLQIALNYAAFQAVCLNDIRSAYITCREVSPFLILGKFSLTHFHFQAREDAILGGNRQDPVVVDTIEKMKKNMDSWQGSFGPNDCFRDDNPSVPS
jgi:hypothetical protein